VTVLSSLFRGLIKAIGTTAVLADKYHAAKWTATRRLYPETAEDNAQGKLSSKDLSSAY